MNPNWQQIVRGRLAVLRLPPERESEIVEEVALHLEAIYDEARAKGMSETAAEAHAVNSYDWRLLECELSRVERRWQPPAATLEWLERKGGMRMESLWQDLRFGARILLKQPGFTLIAVITLALGIGATTAIFSVVNAVLLRPLPFPQSERIVHLWQNHSTTNRPRAAVRYPDFQAWQQKNQVFAHLAAYREDGFNLQTGAETRRVNGARVTVDFFNVLGVQPAVGRDFTVQEDAPGGERVVILSYALWQQGFGGDVQVLGQQLKVDGQNHTIVGVMPFGFSFPDKASELWFPYSRDFAQLGRSAHFLRVLGRLKADATVAQARTDLDAIAQRLEQSYPDTNKDWRVTALPLHEAYSGELQRPLYILLGAVLFVLLIACANVANLLLARNAARERELAVRVAMGAGRGRLIRQLLTESLLLVAVGGVGALLLAACGVELLTKFGPRNIPRLQEAALDASVLGFTLAVSVLTGLIFGLAPAWQRSGLDANAALKAGARATGGAGQGLRKGLVIAEVALSLLLLIGAGLMLKSFVRLQQVAPGFDAQRGLTMEINLATAKYAKPEQRTIFLEQLLARLRTLPGVAFAGATHRLPLRGNSGASFEIEGRPITDGQERNLANFRVITPEYFRALGTPLVAGRTYTDEEGWRKPSVVVINQTLARRHWPDENPVGKRLRLIGGWLEIVGVAADAKENGLTADVSDSVYVPYGATPGSAMTLVLRTDTDPLSLVSAVTEEIRRADPEQAVSGINTLSGLLNEATAQPRFNTSLLALFALLALVLAAVGIYGVIAFAVAQRTQEIGVRMALGATARDVLRLVLAQGLKLTLCGVGIGLLAAFALTRWMKALLFGVSATDPLMFGGIAVLLTFIALLACWIPARRATKVDPLIALRSE